MGDWIAELVRTRYGTVKALAHRIGMTESGFSRAAKAGTFDVENCLRLALETGECAATVFQRAGKIDVHGLITRLYGEGASTPLSRPEQELVQAFRALESGEDRKLALRMLDALTVPRGAGRRRTPER